ncbi:hypothetical protein [Amycolatopsis sp. SID8362]|uniref:hypothetical protein n=1 Tax=Amycolatopsis sp. SID8362 TaxID=2690346 RepID=UPI0013698326|nr:hypothetical protein [Amycolatopsis sp. SID8362]NBH04877.1 hypothetical protein [Amycolatopsis sp. SID8362]NED41578.1 hypothetical protein [Amycolatopsis sp. SID8362]
MGQESELSLSAAVTDRLEAELGTDAAKVLGCLRTAQLLLTLAETDTNNLRLAESAAYNLREALDHVVEGRDAAEGGLKSVIDTWRRYKLQAELPGADIEAARRDLDELLQRIQDDGAAASHYARRLLTYFRDRAGIDPLRRPGDPVKQYGELRNAASAGLHDGISVVAAQDLYRRTITWFIRVFTPPDAFVAAVRALAAQPWIGQHQIAELEQLATDDHYLRRFFGEVADPAWLDPLHASGVAGIPAAGAQWPASALLDGLAKTDPESVAHFLERTLEKTKEVGVHERSGARFELLRIAVQLGPAGHRIVTEVIRAHGDWLPVRSLAVDTALAADAADPIVLTVADVVLNHYQRFADGDDYHATEIIEHLQRGVTAANAAARATALAGKARRLAADNIARHSLGIEALTAELDEHPEPLLLLIHHLARILGKARERGVAATVQLKWIGSMPGAAGERLRAAVLAGAEDVPLAEKIDHVTRRLQSRTATAEDLALVNDVLARSPADADLDAWADAWGTPSPALDPTEHRFPDDWARAWRWAAVLPSNVLTRWSDVIDRVSSQYNHPDPAQLTGTRSRDWEVSVVSSPYSTDELSTQPVLEAAAVVASWEPSTEREGWNFGREELARALSETVKADPAEWSAKPAEVVAVLGQPLYIESYLQALADRAADLLTHAEPVLTVALAQPAPCHNAVLDLIRALATKDAAVGSVIDALWDRALEITRQGLESGDLSVAGSDDPFIYAVDQPWGHGCQTILALAAWEFRNCSAVRPEFEHILDTIMKLENLAGLGFRAILAARRPLLEAIASRWLDRNQDALFREGLVARETFDLTVRWAEPTSRFYREYRSELITAALRGADRAVRLVVVAALNGEESYGLDWVLDELRKKPAALGTAIRDSALIAQHAPADSPRLAAALRFWHLLLDAAPRQVPGTALAGLGRWVFVESIDDDEWLRLTAQTLEMTGGGIEHANAVADRAARTTQNALTQGILLTLLDAGKRWERHHAARRALDVLRTAPASAADESLRRLRVRLIDLGYHEAAEIRFPDSKF